MQKIMFNDRYGLTDAVIEGRKIMTRRLADPKQKYQGFKWWQPCLELGFGLYGLIEDDDWELIEPRYHLGEVVAVAQSYEQIGANPQHYISRPDIDGYQIISMCPGWRNKIFVRAELMPHQIRIKGVRCERLQDISDEDCMKEGVVDVTYFKTGGRPYELFALPGHEHEETFNTPRQAFAALIDKVSGRGTWDRNPWVAVYKFELVK